MRPRFQLVSQNQTRTMSSPRSPQFHPSPLTVARRVAVSGAVPYEVEDRLEKQRPPAAVTPSVAPVPVT